MTFNLNRKQQVFKMEQIFAEPQNYDLILIGGQEAQMSKRNAVILDFANYLGKFNFLPIG